MQNGWFCAWHWGVSCAVQESHVGHSVACRWLACRIRERGKSRAFFAWERKIRFMILRFCAFPRKRLIFIVCWLACFLVCSLQDCKITSKQANQKTSKQSQRPQCRSHSFLRCLQVLREFLQSIKHRRSIVAERL